MYGVLEALCSSKLVIIHTINAALCWILAFGCLRIDPGLAIQFGFLATMITIMVVDVWDAKLCGTKRGFIAHFLHTIL